MSVEVLLSRLDGVRQVAHGRFRAKCPAHDASNANVLSIGEASDGTVLVKCFHGCTAQEVVQAVGLDLRDLFPRIDWQSTGAHHVRPRRPRIDWAACVLACERDLLLTKIVLAAIARGEPIGGQDASACQSASSRVLELMVEARHG